MKPANNNKLRHQDLYKKQVDSNLFKIDFQKHKAIRDSQLSNQAWDYSFQSINKLTENMDEDIDLGIAHSQLYEELCKIFPRTAKIKLDRLVRYFIWSRSKWTATTGSSINQTVLAGIIGSSQQAVSMMLDKLVSVGWITCTDNSYLIGNYSKSWKSTGYLQKVLKSIPVVRAIESVEQIKQLARTGKLNGCAHNKYLEVIRNYYSRGRQTVISICISIERCRDYRVTGTDYRSAFEFKRLYDHYSRWLDVHDIRKVA